MRLLVCGDREWKDKAMILNAIAAMQPRIVIEGEARGADRMAGRAAESLGIKVRKFPADWDEYGKAAGPIRNQQMLDEGRPTLVLACHDDLAQSRGTLDMVKRAHKVGVPVVQLTHVGDGKKRRRLI